MPPPPTTMVARRKMSFKRSRRHMRQHLREFTMTNDSQATMNLLIMITQAMTLRTSHDLLFFVGKEKDLKPKTLMMNELANKFFED